jgi:hypothetical protein
VFKSQSISFPNNRLFPEAEEEKKRSSLQCLYLCICTRLTHWALPPPQVGLCCGGRRSGCSKKA